jgi:hypothetical protein
MPPVLKASTGLPYIKAPTTMPNASSFMAPRPLADCFQEQSLLASELESAHRAHIPRRIGH